ncbi:hypothetical protein F511_41321 [Dorcoceras hygrometricum]|uniref:Uncharacterized protein n=1 Tax=Dorcoceras hygrometricum TaxID=472368 RepID=A0A2Z7D566_9LAMI|nr:hypothetical protein F511_41321 [Dorcoceras hygrometricum]
MVPKNPQAARDWPEMNPRSQKQCRNNISGSPDGDRTATRSGGSGSRSRDAAEAPCSDQIHRKSGTSTVGDGRSPNPVHEWKQDSFQPAQIEGQVEEIVRNVETVEKREAEAEHQAPENEQLVLQMDNRP